MNGYERISPSAGERVPAQARGVSLHREGGSPVLRDEGGNDVCLLNDTAAALWESCDGTTTVAEIVLAARQLWRVAPATAEQEIRSAIDALAGAGVIHWNEGGGATDLQSP